MGEARPHGDKADNSQEATAFSGWVTTQQAAKALDISPRTVRWHIEQGNIEARPEGEGVRRTWLVSIDSLQAFRDARQARDTRQVTADIPDDIRISSEGAVIAGESSGSAIRELADRLAEEAARAAEYRVRLELTEQAQSTLEEELGAERTRREQAERERDELATQLAALQEQRESPETPPEEAGEAEPRSTTEETPERKQQRSWLYRFFFGPS